MKKMLGDDEKLYCLSIKLKLNKLINNFIT